MNLVITVVSSMHNLCTHFLCLMGTLLVSLMVRTSSFNLSLKYCILLVTIDSFADPLQLVNFTMVSSVSWLYHPSIAVTQASVSDSDIHWTNDIVQNGEDKVYSPEYPNPANLNTLFSDVGAGVHTFSCFYRMSPVTLLGSLQLALRGKLIENGRYGVLRKTIVLIFRLSLTITLLTIQF